MNAILQSHHIKSEVKRSKSRSSWVCTILSGSRPVETKLLRTCGTRKRWTACNDCLKENVEEKQYRYHLQSYSRNVWGTEIFIAPHFDREHRPESFFPYRDFKDFIFTSICIQLEHYDKQNAADHTGYFPYQKSTFGYGSRTVRLTLTLDIFIKITIWRLAASDDITHKCI